MLKTFFVVLFCTGICLSQKRDVQQRFVGLVEDIKYVGEDPQNASFLFWVVTNRGNHYIMKSSTLPYLNVNDSLMEYWVDYRLSGIGNKYGRFFYSITQKN